DEADAPLDVSAGPAAAPGEEIAEATQALSIPLNPTKMGNYSRTSAAAFVGGCTTGYAATANNYRAGGIGALVAACASRPAAIGRDYFVFNFSSVSGTVTGATLRFANVTNGGGTTNTYTLRAYTPPGGETIASLGNGTNASAVWTALRSNPIGYGSASVLTSTTPVSVTIAAAGLTAFNTAIASATAKDVVLAGTYRETAANTFLANSVRVATDVTLTLTVNNRPNGATCGAASDCASGFCADGVCCNTACGGGVVDCQACSTVAGAAVNGTCGAAAAGATCRPAVDACDTAEACDGVSTTCPAVDAKSAAGTPCTDGVSCSYGETCDGAGTCGGGTSYSCSGDVCNARSCSGSAPPNDCTLAPNNGVSCGTNSCTNGGLNSSLTSPTCGGGVAGTPGTAATCGNVVTSCGGYVCASATACRTTCGSDADCLGSHYCSGGSCQPKKTNGTSCGGAAECLSGTCSSTGFVAASTCNGGSCSASTAARCNDGNACTVDPCSPTVAGGCQAKTTAAAGTVCRSSGGVCDVVETCDGVTTTCPPVDAVQPSGTTCTDDGNACTRNLCNGASKACQYTTPAAAGTACASDGNACTTDQCDGVTTTCQYTALPDGTFPVGCSGYLCQTATCTTDCVDDTGCNPASHVCDTDTSTCQPRVPNGTSCLRNEECVSGICSDGICCDATCGGQCESCGVPGFVGACTTVPANQPAPTSKPSCATDATTCGTQLCNGADRFACHFPGAAVTCGEPSCAAGTGSLTPSCNGAGACSAPATVGCSPYVCGSTACLTSCTNDFMCDSNNRCNDSSQCQARLANGGNCYSGLFGGAQNRWCLSGRCVAGFLLSATCQACNANSQCSYIGPGAFCDLVAASPTFGRCQVGTTCNVGGPAPADPSPPGPFPPPTYITTPTNLWANNFPAFQNQCMTLRGSDGRWVRESCGTNRQSVCEGPPLGLAGAPIGGAYNNWQTVAGLTGPQVTGLPGVTRMRTNGTWAPTTNLLATYPSICAGPKPSIALGAPPTTFVPVAGLGACTGANNQWYYDDPSNPASLTLCPSSCAAVQRDPAGRLSVDIGCLPIIPPPPPPPDAGTDAAPDAPPDAPFGGGGGPIQTERVEDYLAVCPAGESPLWTFLAYQATTPSDSQVVWEVRVAVPDGGTSTAWTVVATTTRAAGNED
ncbi:MAG: hypothetical protein FJ104_06320, partial [Deltaproteobacteria bacterium]|nr:hypothetical protein [Deltaproteobacteria bacterium]